MPSTLFLSSASYSQKKKQVIVEFSNHSQKAVERFQFFPSLLFNLEGLKQGLVAEILSTYNQKKFKYHIKGNALHLSAATFSDLKRISNLLFSSFNRRPFFLEPEREFLLERNWSYFDSFILETGNIFKKNAREFPSAKIGFLARPLEETVEELIGFSKEDAKSLVEMLALSNILFLPLHAVPGKKFLQAETLVENTCFRNGFAPLEEKNIYESFSQSYSFFSLAGDSLELDFSPVWTDLIQKHNLGFESVNCDCCKPLDLFEENVLPHSLVRVEFLKEGDFFESFLPSFSKSFHEQNPFKESRLRKKSEFFLRDVPVGPFLKGQLVGVPLLDALNLLGEGRVKLLEGISLEWRCLKKRSFLARELKDLSLKLHAIELSISLFEKNALKEHGLSFSQILSKDLNFFFLNAYREKLLGLLFFLPFFLSFKNSRFFDSRLAFALTSLQFSTLKKFKSFAESEHLTFFDSSNKRIFLRGEKALEVVSTFFPEKKGFAPLVKNSFRG